MTRLIIAVLEEKPLNPTISKFQVHQVNGRHIKRWRKSIQMYCVLLLLFFYYTFFQALKAYIALPSPAFPRQLIYGVYWDEKE